MGGSRIQNGKWRKAALAVVLLLALFGAMLVVASSSTEGAPGDKLYWSDPVAGKIQRADLNGSNVEDILTGLPGPGDLAIDSSAGKMYWASPLGIRRANLDGTGLEDSVAGVPAFRVALDPIRSKVYWTEFGERIRRANYDGTNVEDLVTTGFDFGGPFGVADADGLPCYLETMKERNVVFYEKHGFQVVVGDDLPKGGPHFWTMKRPAKG